MAAFRADLFIVNWEARTRQLLHSEYPRSGGAAPRSHRELEPPIEADYGSGVRRVLLALMLLVACNTSPEYQGNVVLGSFAFTGVRLLDSCPFDSDDGGLGLTESPGAGNSGPLTFTGVFSLETLDGGLFLNIGGLSRSGSLLGNHFDLSPQAALRSLGCGNLANQVDETISGDFYQPFSDGGFGNYLSVGCPWGPDGGSLPPSFADGGPVFVPSGDGGLSPTRACGVLLDQFRAAVGDDGGPAYFPDGGICVPPWASDDGGGAPGSAICSVVYQLSGVLQ